jgi:hypothetical protein
MTVDKARQDSFAAHIEDLGVGWNGDLAAAPDRLDFAGMDYDHGIFYRRPAGAIDQFPTAYDECFLWQFFLRAMSECSNNWHARSLPYAATRCLDTSADWSGSRKRRRLFNSAANSAQFGKTLN